MKNGDLPAMPIEFSGFGQFAPEAHIGLTKRERFAMAAMQGLLAGVNGDASLHKSGSEWVKDITVASVEFSDALLAELENQK